MSTSPPQYSESQGYAQYYQYNGHWYPVYPQATPPKKMDTPLFVTLVCIGSVLAAIFLLVILSLLAAVDAEEASASEAVYANETGIEASDDNSQSFGEGTWRVGTEIEPGTYVTTVEASLFELCSVERLSGFSGSAQDIIAFESYASEGTRGRITIDESDTGVDFWGDCTWTKEEE